jgi:hypothetical protein
MNDLDGVLMVEMIGIVFMVVAIVVLINTII